MAGGHMGGPGVRDIQILSEPQNGCPAVTARCLDHKWTSHYYASTTAFGNDWSCQNRTLVVLSHLS